MLAGRKKPLNKTGLKRTKPVAKKLTKKLEDRTAQQLIKLADTWYSRFIRLRDSEMQGDHIRKGKCIDCNKPITVMEGERWVKSGDCGHYISRGVFSLRYDPRNTHLQATNCNAWRDKEDVARDYRNGLDKKLGIGTADELRRLSKLPDAYKRPSKDFLLALIKTCKNYVKERTDA